MDNNLDRIDNNKKRFLEFLAGEGAGNVSYTCDKLGIARSTAYLWRKEDEEFKKAWEDAYLEGCTTLADEAEHALRNHMKKNVTAVIFTLKNIRPEKWNDRYEVGATVHNILEVPDDVKKAIKQGFREALKRGGSEDTPSTGV